MRNVPLPQPIALTDEEKEILKEIEFGPGGYYATDNDAPARLIRSLLRRQAIPEARLRYLADPDYFISSLKGSRLDYVRGRNLEEKANRSFFGPYLKYLIYGPDLPRTTIEGFHHIVVEDLGTSGELMDRLCRFVRAETRRLGLAPSDAREEFFKLAIECDLDLWFAECVRNAAGQASNQLARRRRR